MCSCLCFCNYAIYRLCSKELNTYHAYHTMCFCTCVCFTMQVKDILQRNTITMCSFLYICGWAYLNPLMPSSYITQNTAWTQNIYMPYFRISMYVSTLFFTLCVTAANIRKFPKRRVNSEFTGLAHNLALLIILPGHDLSEPTEPFLVLCTFCWVLSI